MGGRAPLSRLLIHFGMLLAGLAFASWWMSVTLLNTGRTARITDAALSNAAFRGFVADRIAQVTVPADDTATAPAPAAVPPAGGPAAPDAARHRAAAEIAGVLGRPDIRMHLEAFVQHAHDLLIGRSATPAVLDAATTRTIVAAAMPDVPPAELATIHPITFDVPRSRALDGGRTTFAHRFPLYALGAVVLVAAGLALGSDRHATAKLVGRWLLGISAAHLVVLWLLPVVIVPRVVSSPWADLVSAIARAVSAGLVVGLAVLAGAGVAFLLADHWIPAPAAADLDAEP